MFGLVVGIVAKFLLPGRDPGGFVITAILGIVGALVGGFVGRLIGWYGEGDPVGFVMAVVGSIILLAIYRFAFGEYCDRLALKKPALLSAGGSRGGGGGSPSPTSPIQGWPVQASRARRSQREEIPG